MHTDEKHHKQYVTAQQHEFEMSLCEWTLRSCRYSSVSKKRTTCMDVEERKVALFFFNNFGNSTVQGREKKTEQGGDQAAAKSMARNLLSTVDTGDSHSKVVNSKLYSI